MNIKFEEAFAELVRSVTEDCPSDLKVTELLAQIKERNKLLSDLLQRYINDRDTRVKENTQYKKVTFWLFVTFLGLLTLGLIAVIVISIVRDTGMESVATVITAAVAYVGSFLAIFKIIADHLFPSNEDETMVSLLKVILNNDIDIQKLHAHENLEESKEKE